MRVLSLPFYDHEMQIALPDRWEASVMPVHDAPPLSLDELHAAFRSPIGTPRIRDLAKGKRRVAIVVEDVTRPTPVHLFLPFLLDELFEGGIASEDIHSVSAIGCHRPHTTPDWHRKLGRWIADQFVTVNPNLYEGQRFVGTTTHGTAVRISGEVADADLKIGVGGIVPHSHAGFGGGAKILLPGVAAWESICHIHSIIAPGGYGVIEGNAFRENIDEAGQLAGLDAVVNGVVGRRRSELVGLFIGDPVAAHRAGVALARQLYTVHASRNADIAIIDGYPLDISIGQSLRSLGANMPGSCLRDGGTGLLISAAPDGDGYHALTYRDGNWPTWQRHTRGNRDGTMHWLLYSPNAGVRHESRFHVVRSPEEAVAYLEAQYPGRATVNVFPQGALALLA